MHTKNSAQLEVFFALSDKALYQWVLDFEEQLLCSEVQAAAEYNFDELRKSFESFQSKIWVLNVKAKCKKHAT
jgi:hypothetical protein